MQTTNRFFNEIRFKQLLSILKNSRPDYRHAMCQKSLHGAIYDASREYNPINWHQLILELPHIAKDGISLGYYRKDSDIGKTVTTVKPGKYIKRHFPQIPDNIIRDIVNPYIIKAEILDDLDAIIAIMESDNVPSSCMTGKNFNIHPYRCYDPKFGWKLVIKKSGDNIIGRALINENNYVRAYTSSTSSNSGTTIDCALENWLDSQGYDSRSAWPTGTKLAKIEYKGDIVAPYIDGSKDNLNDHGDYLTICSDGDYEACNTNGFAENHNKCTCSDCGDRVSEDELHYPGDYSDGICESCLNSDYTYISEVRINGRWMGGIYVRNNEVIQSMEGDNYPRYEYSDYNIVELANGDYCEIDNAICVNDEYYHIDDIGDSIVEIGDSGEYELMEDCVKLHNDEYALSDNAQLLHNGEYALSDDTVELHNGEYALSDDTVELHNGEYALIDDTVELNNGEYALSDDIGTIVIELDNGEYELSQIELI